MLFCIVLVTYAEELEDHYAQTLELVGTLPVVRVALATIDQILSDGNDWKHGLDSLERLDIIPKNTKFISYLAVVLERAGLPSSNLRMYVGSTYVARARLENQMGYPELLTSALAKGECRYKIIALLPDHVNATPELSDHVGRRLPGMARSFLRLLYPSQPLDLLYVFIAIEEVICRAVADKFPGKLLNTKKGRYWATEIVMNLWWVVPRQLLAAGVEQMSSLDSLDNIVPTDSDRDYLEGLLSPLSSSSIVKRQCIERELGGEQDAGSGKLLYYYSQHF